MFAFKLWSVRVIIHSLIVVIALFCGTSCANEPWVKYYSDAAREAHSLTPDQYLQHKGFDPKHASIFPAMEKYFNQHREDKAYSDQHTNIKYSDALAYYLRFASFLQNTSTEACQQ